MSEIIKEEEEYDNPTFKKWRERLKNYVPPPYVPQSKDYTIGYLLGELIFSADRNSMPTLAHEPCCSGNCITISEEDQKEYDRLHDIWSEAYDKGEKDKWGTVIKGSYDESTWVAYRKFAHELQHKYLPNPWRWHGIRGFQFEWNDEMSEGLISSLWGCDGCTYSLKTFKYVVDSNTRWRHDYLEFYLDPIDDFLK